MFGLLAVLFGMSLASAGEIPPDDASTLISLAQETHAICRLGENIGATTISAIETACDTSKVYWKALTELGYCFDKGERTWYRLPFAKDGFSCAVTE